MSAVFTAGCGITPGKGGQDRIMPPEATGNRLPGPHAIIWTHADEVNRALLDFIRGLPARP
jgi:hypothetical protein